MLKCNRNTEEESLAYLVVITGGVVVGGCGERKVSLYCDIYGDGDGLCNRYHTYA